ncbi:MAG: hypothetical protein ACTHJI_04450 [Leifsonia sp.]
MDQFWASVAGALVGAGAAGAISALIARAIFKAERKARQEETNIEHERRDQERLDEAHAAVIRLRTTAISELITLIRDVIYSGGFEAIPLRIQNAAQALLFDRTDESYTVYQWVSLKLRYIADHSAHGQGNVAPQFGEVIIAMLIGWTRDEPGVLANMQRELDAERVPD